MRDGDAIAGRDRAARPLRRVRARRRHARLASARPWLVRRPGRPVARALRPGDAGRGAASGAGPRAGRRRRRQGPGPARPRATPASRRRTWPSCCASAAIDQVTVVGLATDYCVLNTALDALRNGFGVTVDSNAVRAVEVQPGDGRARARDGARRRRQHRAQRRARLTRGPRDWEGRHGRHGPHQGGSMERHGSESYFVIGEGLLDVSVGGRVSPLEAAAAAPPFRFSRMGPRGAGVQLPEGARKKLAQRDDGGGGGPSGIPAGFTYLGQFVDHDLTFDRTEVHARPARLARRAAAGPLAEPRPRLALRRRPARPRARRSSTRPTSVHLKIGKTRRRRATRRWTASTCRAARGPRTPGQAQGRDPGLPQRREPRRRPDAPRVHPLPQPGRRHAARIGAAGAALHARRASSRSSTTSG